MDPDPPNTIWDEDEQRLVSHAQVGEGAFTAIIALLGANPVVQGRDETLPPVGGRRLRPDVLGDSQARHCLAVPHWTAAGHGAPARAEWGFLALSVKREPQHVACG
jgi:hypothetical protein